MLDLKSPIYTDENKAREYMEQIRWPNGAVCPHCNENEDLHRMEGEKHRPGIFYCRSCRGQFSVTVGTCFERSHIPLTKWVLATHLLCASKKGMSSLQLSRMLGLTYKTAWFMTHRIREAMRGDNLPPIGGANKVVEVDETYVGGKEKNRHANKKHRAGRGAVTKQPVVSLVERGGRVRSFHMPQVTAKTLKPILKAHINKRSYVMTDESRVYPAATGSFAGHGHVNHSAGEYGRGMFWHTNTVENYFSILKRGITGTFHHVSQQHLARYVSEFDFRYNNRDITDDARTVIALKGMEGKRITYRRSDDATA